MSQGKEEPLLTSQDVTNWIANKSDGRTTRRIEEDLRRPDSEVKEYMEWMADPKRSTPRLVERRVSDVIKAGRAARRRGRKSS